MALTKAQRAARRDGVLGDLRPYVWRRDERGKRIRVELTLQHGRRRPRVSGFVTYVAASGGFALLTEDNWPEERDGAPASILGYRASLHVPVDVIRSVRPAGQASGDARVRPARR